MPGRLTRRRWKVVSVIVVVLLVHAWVVGEVARRMPSFEGGSSDAIKRLDVAFVRELEVQAPPPAMAPPQSAPAPPSQAVVVDDAASAPKRQVGDTPTPEQRAVAAERARWRAERREKQRALARQQRLDAMDAAQAAAAASAPPPVAAQPEPTTVAAATVPSTAAAPVDTPVPDGAPRVATAGAAVTSGVESGPLPAAGATPVVAARASSAGATQAKTRGGTDFEWPPSTRLDYALVGNYRGEIHGSARVQWIRQEARYQVHMDVVIGPPFAPLMSRRMTSDGELGVNGLVPRRYQEETRVPFRTRRSDVQIDDRRVLLATGVERPTPAGVQDSASQFVQLSFLFSLDPTLLRPGASITMPVALARRVDPWIYDVVGEETLSTPMGELKAFHVKPRRESPRPGELTAQAWYAPSLRYLPVRILIHQDDETFVDLVLKAAPTMGIER